MEPEEKHCAECDKDLRHIGEEVSERYEYVPAELLAIKDIWQKYADQEEHGGRKPVGARDRQ